MKKKYKKLFLIALSMGVSIPLFSQNIGINTSGAAANTSAILDLNTGNTFTSPNGKGFLVPTVALTSVADAATIASPATSLMVYVPTGSGLSPAGYYYNSGTPVIPNWVAMGGASSLSGAGTLNYLARWTPNGATLGIGVSLDNGITAAINSTATLPVANQMLTVTGNTTAINAIVGNTTATGGAGVIGTLANSGASGGYGVKGTVSGAGGGFQYAIYGASTVTAGNGIGVWGQATGGGAAINYGGYFNATGGASNYAIVVPSGGGNSGFNTITPVSTVDVAGSFGTGTYNFTTGVAAGTYTLTTLANASTYIATPPASGTYTLVLPSPVNNPRQIYTIVYYGTGAGTIAISTPANTIYQNGTSVNPFPLTGGSAVFQSDGANWQVLSNNGISTANNGLSLAGTNVQLGGSNLIHNSTVPLNNNTLSVSGTTETTTFATTGQVGFGNAAPNAKSIVDLTNATNFGLMLPGMSTASLPAIGPAQNGLVVFNTTIGCPEYAYNSVWVAIGATHNPAGQVFNYTGAIQPFTVPNCISSITVIANGAAGGYGDIGGGDGATVTATLVVIPGETLDIVCGGQGVANGWGAGGGGGTFVWNAANTTTPLVVAGGGGGGGGSGSTGFPGSLTTAANGGANVGAGGAGGGAGSPGAGVCGGAGGGGWNTLTGNPASATAHLASGGVGEPGSFNGGIGATSGAQPGGAGGYGGGGGGSSGTNFASYGGGGGGGGYNGGGGGNGASNNLNTEYGGAGGGSCVNGANPVSVTNTTSTGDGSVTIIY